MFNSDVFGWFGYKINNPVPDSQVRFQQLRVIKRFCFAPFPPLAQTYSYATGDWAIAHAETYESNFIDHDFAQFGKHHSRYKTILPTIILSQGCCEIYFISLTVVNP